jgi:hypothetical protein
MFVLDELDSVGFPTRARVGGKKLEQAVIHCQIPHGSTLMHDFMASFRKQLGQRTMESTCLMW